MKNSSRSRKKSGFSLEKKSEETKSNGVVCESRQASMYEMWRKQIHQDARKMYRTKIPVKKFGKMLKASSGRS